MQLKSITEKKGALHGVRVLVRASLNVPVENGKVVDTYRLERSLETIQYLRQEGAKVIVCGHIGREPTETLEPVLRELQNQMPVVFVRDIYAEDVQKTVEYIAPGGVVLLENLRRWNGETKNAKELAERLASFADIYVNDAFAVSHREHASIVGVPQLIESYAGIQYTREIENLQKIFEPEHPFVFILGGAKVATKMPLIESFITTADTLFIGGVLANDFYKALGYEIGKSKHSDAAPDTLVEISASLTLPTDVVVDIEKQTVAAQAVQKEQAIMDAGPQSVELLIQKIAAAKLVVWNGPLGYCEGDFCEATHRIAEAIAKSDAYSIVGGGDTLSAVDDAIQSQFDFVSTGGGAMLEFLAKKTLPGIEALELKEK